MIIFGAGVNLNKFLDLLCLNGLKINCIVDNDERKWGGKVRGIDICSPRRIKENTSEEVLISVSDLNTYNEISTQLEYMGLRKDIDFYGGNKYLYCFGQGTPGIVSGNKKFSQDVEETKSSDPASKLCFINEGNHLFRTVNDAYIEQYKKLYEVCRKNDLFGTYIVDTWLPKDSNIHLESNYILEHQYIRQFSYCFEWSPVVFEDYVRFMLDFLLKLNNSGIGLMDAHALNATIVEGHHIFVDFGALQCGVTPPRSFFEFLSTHLIPLTIMKKGYVDKAYLMLKNPGIMYTVADIKGYLSDQEEQQLVQLYESAIHAYNKENIELLVNQIKIFINTLEGCEEKTKWIEYQNDEWDWFDDKEKWSDKMVHFDELISKINPHTVIDLAGNMGYYGAHLSSDKVHSIVVDYDYMCIDDLWKRMRKRGYKNVLPIYMSICNPTLNYYKDWEIGESALIPWRKSAQLRFSSDLVIALAIVHHMAFSFQLSFEEIIGQFALFTKKWLVIEFIAKEDKYISDFLKAGFEWYTEENFKIELEKSFTIIECRTSTPKETRKMYLCEKK